MQANLFIIRAFGGMVKLLEPPPPSRMDGSCRHLRIEFVVYQIESKAGMELFLNLAWVLVTAAMAVLWLRFGLREGIDRRTQAVALVVLILILFPVISVSDDLFSLQNPAEADCCLRRDDIVPVAHFTFPAIADLTLPLIADLPPGVLRPAVRRDEAVLFEDHPALAAIDNRPPPAA